MEIFNWSDAKNRKLKEDRGVCFEEIVFSIENGQLLDILEHPNPEKYSDQKLFVVTFDNYAYIVPFVRRGEEIFIITIFPSRMYTKRYITGEN
jgi:uncharacterized DUF497 family protein